MSDRSGKSFELRVAEAYEVLGYQATRNAQVGGRQTDIVAKIQVPGSSPRTLAIECKDHRRPIGNGIVSEFAAVVTSQCAAKLITDGVLVSASGFTADARAVADGIGELTLLSGEELASLIFDVRYPLRELVERYEQDEIFHDYLPLRVSTRSWGRSSSSQEDTFDPLLERLISFDGRYGVSAMLVLADFGAGKTTLLHHIEYGRARAHLAGEDVRIPLFIQLRDFRESQNLDALLRSSFRDIYYRDLPIGLLWQRIEKGSFYLLLDGFDEMVDRSDGNRRLELFHALIPLLRSPSPAILTSRPSYLVEKGELEALLEQIREAEDSVPAPIEGGARGKVAVEQLRRELIEHVRERAPRHRLDPTAKPPEIEVVRLRPLDRGQVENYVAKHDEALAKVGATPKDVLDFIDRTYDLTDLATRPMLLRLIVTTVILGGLDLGDTETQYGPSGLYEMYTHTKLELDADKVHGRDGGLAADARRRLAEQLALEMYRSKALEVNFHDTVEHLAAESRSLRRALSASRLTDAEIATDLAARSFVTLDRIGMCRFIHKSFRGFFVARRIKEALPKLDAMFEEQLEREVLYFLGGFNPTEPSVGTALWAAFRRTPKAERTLRRNLIGALLFTQPKHQKLTIEDVEICELEFGQLRLSEVAMIRSVWRAITMLRLEVTKSDWSGVELLDVHCVDMRTAHGDLALSLDETVLDGWECLDCSIALDIVEATIEEWGIERSRVTCDVRTALRVEDLEVREASVAVETGRMGRALLLGAKVANGFLGLAGDVNVAQLDASESVIRYAAEAEITGKWKLRGSILRFTRVAAEQSAWAERVDAGLQMDRSSIILAPRGISQTLLSLRAGVFGTVLANSTREPISVRPEVWGAVSADEILVGIDFPADKDGCLLGKLLLLWSQRYTELLNDALPGVLEIDDLLAEPDFSTPDFSTALAEARSTVKKQHAALLEREWDRFEDYGAIPE